MTILHHPGDDLVLGYAAGSLAESCSIAIALIARYVGSKMMFSNI